MPPTNQLLIDGSAGEGGGQILRSALALSMVTARPFRLEKIRAGRQKPGLMRQHLTAVQAACTICGAKAIGAELRSQTLTFQPGPVRSGDYHFSIGTAGSATLVLQTVLPALLTAAGNSRLVLEGGTHNPYAPPFDFLARVFLPLIQRMGANVQTTLERPGFYPAGGGRFTVEVTPGPLQPITLLERGEIRRKTVYAVVNDLPDTIARRETARILARTNWPDSCIGIWPRAVPAKEPAHGPGNIILIDLESEALTEVFTGFGEKNISAEAVAEGVADEVLDYLATPAPVGRHLADQLLIPLAMAVCARPGAIARFRTLAPTLHTTTNSEIIRRFLPVAINIEAGDAGQFDVTLRHGLSGAEDGKE